MKKRVYIIAEAGVNHNGDIHTAKKLAMAAKEAGADAVKFQTFCTEDLVAENAPAAEYQKKNLGKDTSQYEMLKKLELSYAEFRELKQYCEKIGIVFLSTPFDLKSLNFLDEIGISLWKVPSGEITNYPYLVRIANTGKPIIMSTGMSEIEEIENALKVLQKNGADQISLLHCTTEYPAPKESVNLRVIDTLAQKFNVSVGYSDHTTGIEIPIAAVARGAEIIEKHFTLSRKMEGPDHKASLEPDELRQMVSCIRNVEMALGDGNKHCTDIELKNRKVARKSIVALKDIKAGDILSEVNLTTKRPGNGICPMEWENILGQEAIRDYLKDEMIDQ